MMQTEDEQRWEEIARGGIEQHLGDVADENENADSLYDEAYTCAFDALVDCNCPRDVAMQIAQKEAMKIAQP